MSKDVFNYIKESIPISRVIGDYVELKSRGTTHKGLCPFHGEKTPSFHVDDNRGMFYCFGCHIGGDVIKFISERERLDPIDACKFIADKYGIDISQHLGKSGDKSVMSVLKDAAEYFRRMLLSSQHAKAYAKGRGIDKDAVQRFLIGYAPDGFNNLISALGQRHSRELLVKSGLFGEKDGRLFDRFRNRLIFPIIDQRGQIVGFGGRALANDPAKYLNSPESDHFKKGELLYALNNCKEFIKESGYIIVTEGYMDVVALSIAGVNNAVATLGTAMTEKHAELLARYTNHIVLCYDSDNAGIKAALNAVDTLGKHIPTVRVCMLGEGLDPDEYVKKYGVEEFRKAIENSPLGMIFKIDYLAGQHNLNNIETYNKFLREATSEIKKLGDMLEKNTYSQYLVQKYDADPKLVQNLVGVYGIREKKRARKEADSKSLSEEELIIRKFVEDHKKITDNTFQKLLCVDFSDDCRTVFYELVSYFEEGRELDYSAVAEDIGMELTQYLQKIVETELSGELPSIEILVLSLELAKISERIKHKPAAEELQRLMSERVRIMNEISGERSKF